jgi:hypothetical protein
LKVCFVRAMRKTKYTDRQLPRQAVVAWPH